MKTFSILALAKQWVLFGAGLAIVPVSEKM
jgi:hypothetical protein